MPAWHFDIASGTQRLCDQLEVAGLDGFGAHSLTAACGAAGALLLYAAATQGQQLRHVRSLKVEYESEYIGLDPATRRNLEITETCAARNRPRLCSLLDTCCTTMGSRLLRHWLHHPPRESTVAQSRQRQSARCSTRRQARASTGLRGALRQISDIERITGRLALLSARPRDLSSLRDTFAALPQLRERLAAVKLNAASLERIDMSLEPPPECLALLEPRDRARTRGADPRWRRDRSRLRRGPR